MSDYPEIAFSPWVAWSTRKSLEGAKCAGVYLLALFDTPPIGRADPQARQIIYIGETCNNSLVGRWRQFERSAFQGKYGHSGGKTYRQEFGDQGQTLYVSALSVEKLDEPMRSLFIRYVERRVIWEYACRWGMPPKCNRK